jgi:hypothetical protein
MFTDSLLKLMIEEHKNGPVKENVLSLEKQSITLPLEKKLQIFNDQDCKINPDVDLDKIKIDETNRFRNEKSIDG